MPDAPLTAVETAALFILLAEARPVPNVKLTQDYRCGLKKKSREKLEKLKLIEVERESGRLVLTLSEKGWAYCDTQLTAESPLPRSGAVGGALYAVLGRWGRFLAAQQLSLAEFVTASDGPATAEGPGTERVESASGHMPDEPGEGQSQAEERIRRAYQMIAPGPGELVSLADLRDRVADLAPAEVEAALRRLHRQRGVTLVPEANQKTLDARTRAAAVLIGDQPRHLITMGAP